MENFRVYYEVTDSYLIKHVHTPELGKNIYRSEVIMDKDTFVECYEKWILNKKEEKEKR